MAAGLNQGVFENELAISRAVEGTSSIREVLLNLGVCVGSANYRAIREASGRFGIELPVFQRTGRALREKKPLAEILVEHSTASRGTVKRRLISEGVLPERCASCGVGPEWNGKPLTLQLEHKNGVPDDNRRRNLALLCPNCHSQTATYAGKNRSDRQRQGCIDCSVLVSRGSERCKECYCKIGAVNFAHTWKPKIDWPPVEDIIAMVEASTWVAVAKKLNVSDVAVNHRHVHANPEESYANGAMLHRHGIIHDPLGWAS